MTTNISVTGSNNVIVGANINTRKTHILVPIEELQKLEQSRKRLYDMLEEECKDKIFLANLLNVTEQVWLVANTRRWDL